MATIYGVDTEGEITPLMVRDAIVRCFFQAHKEVLECMNRENEFSSQKERGNFEKLQADMIVREAFESAGINFNAPSKRGILMVLEELKVIASEFRKPEIIEKHYNEIMKLVEKLK